MKPPIEAVLLELGATDVPTGYGWVRMKCFHKDHHDRTASASVNHDENRYRCHACDLGGDSYDLLQAVLGISYAEALEYGARLQGAEIVCTCTHHDPEQHYSYCALERVKHEKKPRKRRVSELLGGVRDSASSPAASHGTGGRVRRALGLGDELPGGEGH